MILSTTLFYTQKKSIFNHGFGDAVLDQVLATQSQCGVFVLGENYYPKVLSNGGNLIFKDYHSLYKAGKDKYDIAARKLVVSRLIISNSLSSRTCTYLKDQYVMNQLNYPDTVIATVAMITSFGSDIGDGGNKTTNDTDAIISIHLADYSSKCFKHDNDGSIESFESTANDGRTSSDDVSIADAPDVAGELENDNIDDDIITGDNDDDNNNDNSDTEDMSSDDDDDDSTKEDSVSADDNTTFSTKLPDASSVWM